MPMMTSDYDFTGFPSLPVLQWQSEAEAFLEFMRARRVRSYLEIGTASGRFALLVKRALRLSKVAACDLWYSPLLQRDKTIEFFAGDHQSAAYREWRNRQGHVDMVFIDADHEHGFRDDYEIERAYPHEFIALHDVANKAYPALREFWQNEVQGQKWEFVNTDRTAPFGIPSVRYPFGTMRTFEEYVEVHGYACGVGIVRQETEEASGS